MTQAIATVPQMELTPQQISNLVEELHSYHAIYSPLFQRREQREQAVDYLNGLMLSIGRKSIEPIVLALKGADPNVVFFDLV